MLENHDTLIERVKKEVQGLFASEKIQNLFVDSLKNSIRNEDQNSSGRDPNSRSRTVSDNSIKPSYNIRKTSTEFRDKGLIVPATKMAFGSGANLQKAQDFRAMDAASFKSGPPQNQVRIQVEPRKPPVKATSTQPHPSAQRTFPAQNFNNYNKHDAKNFQIERQPQTNQFFTQNNFISSYPYNQQKTKPTPYSNIHIFRDVSF